MWCSIENFSPCPVTASLRFAFYVCSPQQFIKYFVQLSKELTLSKYDLGTQKTSEVWNGKIKSDV